MDRMTELVAAGIITPPEAVERRVAAERVKLRDGGSLDAEVAAQRR